MNEHCNCGEELTPFDIKGKCDNCLKQTTAQKTDIKILTTCVTPLMT
ncbi:hypothetical protein [Faucicola boevrei]|nr:hypothetical protein [Moraxella boevrei]